MDYGVEYSAHYEYTATESGTLIVSTTTTTDELTILVNGVELTVATNAEIDLDVDDSVSIVIEGSTSGQSATIALNFQAK
jgi:hypothetical protein